MSSVRTTPKRTADIVRRALESEIVSGALGPGERLDETVLARRFEVSRTPVREALMQLASGGLIEMRPRQGAIVATVTAKQLFEMFEVMSELEAQCAKFAARRMTEVEHEKLRRAIEACQEAADKGSADAYYDANQAFHETIYAGSHNSFLEQQTTALRNRLSGYRRIQLHRGARILSSLSEHKQVMAHIMAGDGDGASEAMRSHVMIQGDGFIDLLSSLNLGDSARRSVGT